MNWGGFLPLVEKMPGEKRARKADGRAGTEEWPLGKTQLWDSAPSPGFWNQFHPGDFIIFSPVLPELVGNLSRPDVSGAFLKRPQAPPTLLWRGGATEGPSPLCGVSQGGLSCQTLPSRGALFDLSLAEWADLGSTALGRHRGQLWRSC